MPDATFQLRNAVRGLLALPDPIGVPAGRVIKRSTRGQELDLDGRPALFLTPDGQGPWPAVLYAHAHGGRYDLGRREVTEGARWLSAPYGPDLTRAGFAVLCVDMPGFGARRSDGSESALAKAGLWEGRPLFGQMVADQLAGFAWLAAHPDIDAQRIVTLGMSMGAALAMWTGALEPRVAAVVQLCMLADIAPLIAAGVHDRHGAYLTVPGLLPRAEIGDVAGLIAPHPQFVGHGAQDPLTPPAARDAALMRLRRAYRGTGMLTEWLSPTAGHVETPQMRRAVLDFLNRTCAHPQQQASETC